MYDLGSTTENLLQQRAVVAAKPANELISVPRYVWQAGKFRSDSANDTGLNLARLAKAQSTNKFDD